MYQTEFFAVKSNSAKKLRNFIKLVKRMGIDYNHDWMSMNVLDDYPRSNSNYGLGFSNKWYFQEHKRFSCSMTPCTHSIIDIDTNNGYRDAIVRVANELIHIELHPPLVFSDINGAELKVGDSVVMIDNEDLLAEDEGDDTVFKIGELLVVEKLVDIDPNYIIFKSGRTGLSNGFYGHRVARFLK